MRTLIFLSFFLLAACLPEQSKNEIINIQVAAQNFEFPREYLYKYDPDYKNEVFRIGVMYPEFKPLQKTPTEYFNDGRKFEDIRFTILNPEDHIPIKKTIEKSKTTFAGDYFAGEIYELEKWTSPPPELRDNEIYVYKENGEPLGYLMCTREGAYPNGNPQCSGKFRKFGIQIDISFDKDFLPNWPDIRDRGFALIDSFRVANSTASNKQ